MLLPPRLWQNGSPAEGASRVGYEGSLTRCHVRIVSFSALFLFVLQASMPTQPPSLSRPSLIRRAPCRTSDWTYGVPYPVNGVRAFPIRRTLAILRVVCLKSPN